MARGKKKKYYRINHYIKASKVRVVDAKGKQLGIMALSKALKEARGTGLDLVEVAPKAKPPVCKILNFRDFLSQKRLKRQGRGKTNKQELKEIRLRPFVSKHDLNTKLERVKEFLEEKNNVRLTVFFRGRQNRHKKFGTQLINKIIKQLGDKAKVLVPPKNKGKILAVTLGPNK